MNWRVDFSSRSLMFLRQNDIDEDLVLDEVKLALRKFEGEDSISTLRDSRENGMGFIESARVG